MQVGLKRDLISNVATFLNKDNVFIIDSVFKKFIF